MSRLINAFEQFFDGAGNPLVGGQIHFFESGSSTVRKATFSDSGETSANTNPVLTNGDGRCPNVFGTGSYRAVLRFPPIAPATVGVQILVRDPIGGDQSLTFGADWSADQTYSVTDVVRDGALYWISQTNNNLGNQPSTDAGTNWLEFNSNKFPGDDPTLIDEIAALISGSSFPATEQHIAIGDKLIQSKANGSTKGLLKVNTLGGEVSIGSALIGDKVTIGIPVLQSASLDDVLITTSPALGGILIDQTVSATAPERALTASDKFAIPASNSNNAITAATSDIGKDTACTGGTVVVTISSATGWLPGDEAWFTNDTVSGTLDFAASGGITLDFNRTVPPEKTGALKFISGTTFKYMGP